MNEGKEEREEMVPFEKNSRPKKQKCKGAIPLALGKAKKGDAAVSDGRGKDGFLREKGKEPQSCHKKGRKKQGRRIVSPPDKRRAAARRLNRRKKEKPSSSIS